MIAGVVAAGIVAHPLVVLIHMRGVGMAGLVLEIAIRLDRMGRAMKLAGTM
jgi:hypothetical protein